VARKDGWVALGWRKKDPVISAQEPTRVTQAAAADAIAAVAE
jgi:hypothetical protein